MAPDDPTVRTVTVALTAEEWRAFVATFRAYESSLARPGTFASTSDAARYYARLCLVQGVKAIVRDGGPG